MANGNAYPANLLDGNGKPILPAAQFVQFTDDTDQPGSGGGGGSVATETISTSTSSTDHTQVVSLSLSHSSGDTLLDYTDPTSPTFIASGTYLLISTLAIAGDVTFTANVGYIAGLSQVSIPPSPSADAYGTPVFLTVANAGDSVALQVDGTANTADLSFDGFGATLTKLG